MIFDTNYVSNNREYEYLIFELENDYELPDDIKARFLNSSAEAFIVRERYLQCLRKGLKPQMVLDQSLDDHFGRIKDNAADFDEAFELFDLLVCNY